MKERGAKAEPRRRIAVAVLTVIVLAGLVLGLLKLLSPEVQPVRIGFIGGLSGGAADLGTAGRNGVMLALEEQNAAGGINGRTLELLIYDDRQNPAIARQVAAELIGQQPQVILGPMTSSMALEVIPIADAADVLVISPTVTTQQLLAKDDNFLRLCSSTKEYAQHAARYHKDNLGLGSTSVMVDLGNQAYTEDWSNSYQERFEELGGKVLGVERYVSGPNVLFADLAARLLEPEPEIVLFICNAVDAAHAASQVRQRNAQVQLAMAEWASTERLIELGGRNVEGAIVAQFTDRDSDAPKYLAFLEQYRQRFSMEPGFGGTSSYDAAKLLFYALEQRQPDETIKSAILRSQPLDGLQITISMDRYGDSVRPTMIAQIVDGRFRVMEQQ